MAHQARTWKIRRAFLECIEKGWSDSKAAKAAGQPKRFFTRWAAEDPNFKLDWDDAIEAGTDGLEDVAVRRAKKNSDALLVTMLKARRPDKFREKSSVEHSGGVDLTGVGEKLAAKLERAIAAQKRSGT